MPGVSARGAASRRDPAWAGRVFRTGAVLVALWPLFVATEFAPWRLLEPANLAAGGRFVADFFPPKLDAEFLALVARATWRTVAIATAGIALAMLIAVPAALLAARALSVSSLGGRMAAPAFALRQLVRWLLIVLRSVPELVWALVFVRVVGLGPTSGVLAIALTYGGMLGKVYAEILDSGETATATALLRHGAGRLQAFCYALLPANASELTSYTVYRWECAIRSSVVLGFVGAGGIGQEIDGSMKMFAGGEVATMLLVFVALVALADRASALLRRDDRTSGGGRGWPWAVSAAIGGLVVAAFASLGLQWAAFVSVDALSAMGRFVAEFFPPEHAPAFVAKVARAAWETLAMSLLGTAIAAVAGVALALPSRGRGALRWAMNVLRAIPELVWAALLLVAAGLGPMTGTLALALHTSGVLGRLFAEAIENAPPGPAAALRAQGATGIQVAAYATLPQVLPQLVSYTLYRWENNIRAAAVLGVVGAGGLGQMLAFHLGLFQMGKTATVLAAMLLLVAAVDAASVGARRLMTR